MKPITLYPLKDIPLIKPNDNIIEMLLASARKGPGIQDKDVLVIAQKIISKAEGQIVDLSTITPSKQAEEIALQTGRDARLCQVYLNEAKELIAIRGRMVITRHRLGYVVSSSGVDRSNIASHEENKVVLLPENPDRSAREIREAILKETACQIAVIVNDSLGREDRAGSVGAAIGFAGISAIESDGKKDLFGNPSRAQIALVDELAAAASILMGQADEGVPAVLIRGAVFTVDEDSTIQQLLH